MQPPFPLQAQGLHVRFSSIFWVQLRLRCRREVTLRSPERLCNVEDEPIQIQINQKTAHLHTLAVCVRPLFCAFFSSGPTVRLLDGNGCATRCPNARRIMQRGATVGRALTVRVVLKGRFFAYQTRMVWAATRHASREITLCQKEHSTAGTHFHPTSVAKEPAAPTAAHVVFGAKKGATASSCCSSSSFFLRPTP